MLQGLEDLLITGLVSLAAGAWGLIHFRLKKREQDYLYKLRDRELRMQEEEHNVRVDYLRELVTKDMLELTREGKLQKRVS